MATKVRVLSLTLEEWQNLDIVPVLKTESVITGSVGSNPTSSVANVAKWTKAPDLEGCYFSKGDT